MSTSLNPKKIAGDIAKGMAYLNPVTIKRYTTDDLKSLLSHLLMVQREIRATPIPQEQQSQDNNLAISARNRQLQNINQAITLMNGYAKQHRLRL